LKIISVPVNVPVLSSNVIAWNKTNVMNNQVIISVIGHSGQ